jgi:hypothetical protein
MMTLGDLPINQEKHLKGQFCKVGKNQDGLLNFLLLGIISRLSKK